MSEDNKDFDLNMHTARLLMDEPFFAAISRRIDKRASTAIPTAGVMVNPETAQFEMLYNPKFFADLTDAQRTDILKHEFYHVIFEHVTGRFPDGVNMKLWNIATDLAINSLIDEEELPEGGLIPGKAFSALTPEQVERMGQQAADRYSKVSALIASFPKEQSSEWYFQKLMEDDEVSEAIQSQDKMGGKSLEQALADGDVKIDENGNLVADEVIAFRFENYYDNDEEDEN